MSSKHVSSIIIMLADFSYHPQIHDSGWISFYLKEENAWDIILEVTNFRLEKLTFSFPADKYLFS